MYNCSSVYGAPPLKIRFHVYACVHVQRSTALLCDAESSSMVEEVLVSVERSHGERGPLLRYGMEHTEVILCLGNDPSVSFYSLHFHLTLTKKVMPEFLV